MPFEFVPQPLEGLLLVRPRRFDDPRGYFVETFKASEFRAAEIRGPFLQDNLSVSRKGVLRGIHYQLPPHAQGKLVRVAVGTVWDVCVDLRQGSSTFGHWHGVTLDADTHAMLYVPPGFGHGFVTLSDRAHVLYQCTAEYAPDAERGIRWNDPDLAITWPVSDVIVSAKDASLPPFAGATVFEERGA